MATWQELIIDSLRAARKLLNEEHLRSSISRSYYCELCCADIGDTLSEQQHLKVLLVPTMPEES